MLDIAERARRRRTTNHATTPESKATPRMPLTMPPAIAPTVEVENSDVLDVTVWAALLVEVGIMAV